MAEIKKIYDDAETTIQVYPQTHERAVVDNNGTTAETKFQMITDLVNQKQMEIGAVPSDLTPTDGSTHWVTSGGIFTALENVKKTFIYCKSKLHLNGFLQYNDSWYSSNSFDSCYTDLIPCKEGDVFVWTGVGNNSYSTPTQVSTANQAVTWIFYDSNKTRISSWSVMESTQTITIPSGVAYVRFAGIVRNSSGAHDFNVGFVNKTYDIIPDVGDILARVVPSTLYENAYMKYDGSWASSSSFDSRFTDLVPCSEGDTFIYYGFGGANTSNEPRQITSESGNMAISWIFYNSDKTRVSSWQYGRVGQYVVTIPSGVAYVQFTGIVRSSSDNFSFVVWGDKYITQKKQDELTGDHIPSMFLANRYLLYNDTWESSTSFDSCYTDMIPCSEGDKFLWIGVGSSSYSVPTQVATTGSAVTWIFYNSSKTRVSSWSVKESTQVVTIPSGVAFVRFAGITRSSSGTRPFTVWRDPFIVSLAEGGSLQNKWSGLKWVAVGDSLTENNLRATKNYHDYISEWTGITVVNKGVSGSGYKEMYSSSKAFYQRISQVDSDADVVTIFGSGNDLHLNNGTPKYTLGDVDDTGTTTICGCINTTLDWLQENRPLVPLGIISMTPWASTSVPTANQNAYVEKLEAICKKRGVPFLNLYTCSNLHPNSDLFKNVAYRRDGTYTASTQGTSGAIQVTADNLAIVQAFGVSNAQIGDWVLPSLSGVHPDEAGHKFIAPRIKVFLEELIER